MLDDVTKKRLLSYLQDVRRLPNEAAKTHR